MKYHLWAIITVLRREHAKLIMRDFWPFGYVGAPCEKMKSVKRFAAICARLAENLGQKPYFSQTFLQQFCILLISDCSLKAKWMFCLIFYFITCRDGKNTLWKYSILNSILPRAWISGNVTCKKRGQFTSRIYTAVSLKYRVYKEIDIWSLAKYFIFWKSRKF